MTHASGGQTSARPRRLLGWRPAISLKEGLTKTIPYFEELLAREGVAEAVRL